VQSAVAHYSQCSSATCAVLRTGKRPCLQEGSGWQPLLSRNVCDCRQGDFWSYRNTQISSSGAQKFSKSFCRTLISTAYAAVTRACNRGPTLSDVNNTFCCHTTQTDGAPLMFTRMLCYAHMTSILSPGCCGMRCLNSRMPECLTALLHCDLVVEGCGA
jgi:hypothetical protein